MAANLSETLLFYHKITRHHNLNISRQSVWKWWAKCHWNRVFRFCSSHWHLH